MAQVAHSYDNTRRPAPIPATAANKRKAPANDLGGRKSSTSTRPSGNKTAQRDARQHSRIKSQNTRSRSVVAEELQEDSDNNERDGEGPSDSDDVDQEPLVPGPEHQSKGHNFNQDTSSLSSAPSSIVETDKCHAVECKYPDKPCHASDAPPPPVARKGEKQEPDLRSIRCNIIGHRATNKDIELRLQCKHRAHRACAVFTPSSRDWECTRNELAHDFDDTRFADVTDIEELRRLGAQVLQLADQRKTTKSKNHSGAKDNATRNNLESHRMAKTTRENNGLMKKDARSSKRKEPATLHKEAGIAEDSRDEVEEESDEQEDITDDSEEPEEDADMSDGQDEAAEMSIGQKQQAQGEDQHKKRKLDTEQDTLGRDEKGRKRHKK